MRAIVVPRARVLSWHLTVRARTAPASVVGRCAIGPRGHDRHHYNNRRTDVSPRSPCTTHNQTHPPRHAVLIVYAQHPVHSKLDLPVVKHPDHACEVCITGCHNARFGSAPGVCAWCAGRGCLNCHDHPTPAQAQVHIGNRGRTGERGQQTTVWCGRRSRIKPRGSIEWKRCVRADHTWPQLSGHQCCTTYHSSALASHIKS